MPESELAPPAAVAAVPTRNPLRRLYRWLLSWAHHPAGTWALGAFAFLDSSVFPVPPLFLQAALSIERPRRSWWYATVDWSASVAGAILGYVIGCALWDQLGRHIIGTEGIARVQEKLGGWHIFTFTLLYSFVPFPFKLITIGSGFLNWSLPTLLAASAIGRGCRFFTIAAICRYCGARAGEIIERYFNWVMLGIGLLVAGVLLVMKLYLGGI